MNYQELLAISVGDLIGVTDIECLPHGLKRTTDVGIYAGRERVKAYGEGIQLPFHYVVIMTPSGIRHIEEQHVERIWVIEKMVDS